MFNISEFKARMNRHGGPALTSLFSVTFGNNGNIPILMSVEDLRFFCSSVSLPGINLELMSYREGGIGYPEFMPMDSTPDALNGVFMMDSNHRILSFFHSWIMGIVNMNASAGPLRNGLEPKEINYKSDYSTTMTIDFYSTYDTSRFYRSVFGGVFPTQVSSLNLSWSDKGTPASLSVNFSYNKVYHEGVIASSAENSRLLFSQQGSIPRNGVFSQNVFDFQQRIIDDGVSSFT